MERKHKKHTFAQTKTFLIMKTITERYNGLMAEYAKEFGCITNIPGALSDNMYKTEEYGSFTFDEMRFVVDKEEELHSMYRDIGTEVAGWFNYVMTCVDFGIHTVSLEEWLTGKRKPTKDELAHIQAIRDRLNSEIERLNEGV